MNIVSDQKLRQLRQVIETWISGLVILRGPCGSGKSFALRTVCAELNMNVYDAPESDYLSLAAKLNAATKRVLLSRGSTDLKEAFSHIKYFPNVICVFSLPENDFSFKRISCYIVINFNAFSDTAIRRLISSSFIEGTPSEIVEDIVSASQGDARQALLQLELRGLLSAEPLVETKLKRKRKPQGVAKQSTITNSKDSEYSFFHIIGKILYNKPETVALSDSLANQPMIEDSGDMALLTLHENIPDFVTDITALRDIAEAFSVVDCLWHPSCSEGLQTRMIFKAITVLNQSNGDTTNRIAQGFNTFRRPQHKDAPQRRSRNHQLLSFIREEVPWMNPELAIYVDAIMAATNGRLPSDIAWNTKRRIYSFLRQEHEESETTGESPFQLQELPEDPIEDC